ncbi:hypothetical protein DUNSADRAFT_8133 [Dunaliella salina]|uniref:RWD domain-containing protein n=1 Tax=Dunaliella salina TaxID=3046 RepID=A0ABQ7FUC5_DUNSA|nr:hypothetical protein DUNSADRAFT_8133 [Dunaliella salina]|eukprot:KAF5825612.1 hypothetical protein DUNSADRAFT_8133 [Dunaliella salina]
MTLQHALATRCADRAEEVMVLEAIYGEQVQPMGSGAVHLRLPLPMDCPLALHAEEGLPQECLLEFICSQGSNGATYPACLPIISLSCRCAPAPLLRRITRALVCAGRKLVGQPMLHDLASHASDMLQQLHPDDELSEDEEVGEEEEDNEVEKEVGAVHPDDELSDNEEVAGLQPRRTKRRTKWVMCR